MGDNDFVLVFGRRESLGRAGQFLGDESNGQRAGAHSGTCDPHRVGSA
jgi:hypothetical protein